MSAVNIFLDRPENLFLILVYLDGVEHVGVRNRDYFSILIMRYDVFLSVIAGMPYIYMGWISKMFCIFSAYFGWKRK